MLVLAVTQEDFILSTGYFDPNVSKHHPPFDCLVLALAKAQKVDKSYHSMSATKIKDLK